MWFVVQNGGGRAPNVMRTKPSLRTKCCQLRFGGKDNYLCSCLQNSFICSSALYSMALGLHRLKWILVQQWRVASPATTAPAFSPRKQDSRPTPEMRRTQIGNFLQESIRAYRESVVSSCAGHSCDDRAAFLVQRLDEKRPYECVAHQHRREARDSQQHGIRQLIEGKRAEKEENYEQFSINYG